jgi:hypothetical protein
MGRKRLTSGTDFLWLWPLAATTREKTSISLLPQAKKAPCGQHESLSEKRHLSLWKGINAA